MTGRELLEAAANAAGIEIISWYGDGDEWAEHTPRQTENVGWNPLLDDGDALRLAFAVSAEIYNSMVIIDRDERYVNIGYTDGIIESLRRAITAAAAAIGSQPRRVGIFDRH